MKVSLNWVKQFTQVDLSIETLVAKIGAQLGAVEEVLDLGKKYEAIVVARVVSCKDHPNADRLHVCLLDDGGVTEGVERDSSGLVQVVCGAPNVREGLSVAWLPPGSTVPASFDDDPFVLESRELRGVISNGMIASAKELAISDDHQGILEIDIEAAPGTLFSELYELDDYIIDIENKMFTHRPDCFGILGVAREIAGIEQISFTSPKWYTQSLGRIKQEGGPLELQVQNEIPNLVPRFTALAIAGVSVAPSPIIMQSYLSRVGIRPINNLVDITNYVMYVTAQPLHAYDYDKVCALSGNDTKIATLVARKPHGGEKITLLSGKIVEPHADAVVIATSDSLLGIGGVMGGANSEVDASTKNIILEAASFDMYSIRRTSMAHGLFTDAVTRFNKGQSPYQVHKAIEEAAVLVESLSGGLVASELVDVNHINKELPSVKVSASFINSRLGVLLETQEISTILRNVEFVVDEADDQLVISPPFWRTDIEIAEDIVEEVGRLYGYDNLPLELPRRSISPAVRNRMLDIKQAIRTELVKSGANEVLTYSFVHGKLFEKVGQNAEDAFRISNALSPDLQYYRLSLVPSLLEKIHPNIKLGFDEFVLFENGKAHSRKLSTTGGAKEDEGLPGEEERLALVYAVSEKRSQKNAGAPFYQARLFASRVFDGVGLSTVRYVSTASHTHNLEGRDAVLAPFDLERSAHVFVSVDGRDIWLGIVGELRSSVHRELKLPAQTAAAELDLSALALVGVLDKGRSYQALSRFPKIEQDICLRVSQDVTYYQLEDLLTESIVAHKPAHSTFSLSPVDIYKRSDSDDTRQITMRLTISSYERTLTDGEITQLLDTTAVVAAAKLGAQRV